MKTTTTTTTFFALFLLCALISHLPSATLANVIIDIDDNMLINGGTYYILPVMRGMGGGIEITAIENETCPLTVVQSRNEVSKGLPITITSILRPTFLAEGYPLFLSFPRVPICAPTPSKWTIVKGLPEGPAVKITGYDDENTVNGFFKIERSYLDYKLTFCTTASYICSDIGVHIDNDGNRRLVATEDKPLIVQFKKVADDSSSHAST